VGHFCALQEPVEVEVTVHNAGSVLRVKKLTASIIQYMDGWVDGREVLRRVTVLDKSKHYPKVSMPFSLHGKKSTLPQHMRPAHSMLGFPFPPFFGK
jgi:hypothetical protein